MAEVIDKGAVEHYLLELQQRICDAINSLDKSRFVEEAWDNMVASSTSIRGRGSSRMLTSNGDTGYLFEKAGVNFSHVYGSKLPPAATKNRPETLGRNFEAMGVSAVFHPLNPFVPTAHINVRFFIATKPGHEAIWWFGGGIDLTPFYGFDEDCIHWHQQAKKACDPFSKHVQYDLYERFKTQCDQYFFLPHRNEPRGIGGLFFDDFNELGFDPSFSLLRSVGDSFLMAYLPIVNRRKQHPYGRPEQDFQHYRRGRYVEFNLLYDRGTLFGLQSGGRTEAILMSLPPRVQWRYNWQPQPLSQEARLYEEFLVSGKDWINA